MRITPEGRQCKLRLEFPAGVNVTLPATSFAANDGQSSAVRVKAAALDVIYGPKGRVRANAKLNQDDKLSIEDLRAFSHLMSMENSRSVGVQIQISDRTLDLGAIKMNKAGKDSSWTRMADYMDALWAIEQVAGVDAPELAVSDFNSTGLTLELLSALCGERHIRIDFTPDPSVDPKCDGLLAFSTAQVGSHIYSAVVRRPVKLDRMNAGRRQIAFGQSQLLWAQITNAAIWTEEDVKAAYQRQLDRLAPDCELMAIGNILHIVERGPGDHLITSDLPSGRTRPTERRRRKAKRIA
jgi:hypothetical protein